MAKDQRSDALELALKNEATERKFYLDNAARTNNPLGKAMFLEIADDELARGQLRQRGVRQPTRAERTAHVGRNPVRNRLVEFFL